MDHDSASDRDPLPLAVRKLIWAMLCKLGEPNEHLQIRTEGVIEQRARTAAKLTGIALIAMFALAGVWAAFGLSGYRITAMPPAGSAFAPLAKTVAVAPSG